MRTNTIFEHKVFVDDGFSGVSFEREGLQAMLQEVEAGRVATVITKDLSRLGRNYLKTGELIEIVFPENGVRYIAINDGVDTAREDNEFTPLRNWFNEFYARDTSKKIRAVKQAQAQKASASTGNIHTAISQTRTTATTLYPTRKPRRLSNRFSLCLLAVCVCAKSKMACGKQSLDDWSVALSAYRTGAVSAGNDRPLYLAGQNAL